MKKRIFAFTIPELLVASSIAVLIISAAYTIWIFAQGLWHNERIKSDLLGNIQIAMERMKHEAVFSDGNKVVTSDGGLSFPFAKDTDTDGFIELDASEKIIWDETIVYHIYNNEGIYELRKTIFSPRNNTISASERQGQLETVIEDGNGDDAEASGETAVTSTIITGLSDLVFEISPIVPNFDGYSSSVERSNNVSFGSVLLTPGYHTLTYKITGKDDSSSGYKLGIDTFSITPSGCQNEAEEYVSLIHQDGSPGLAGSSGNGINIENMTQYGVWGGNYQLEYNSGSIGDFIKLRFYYDQWRETNFSQGSLDNVVVKFSNEDGAGGSSGNPDYVLSLDGNLTAVTENSKASKVISPGNGDNTTYRVIVYPPSNGRLFSVKFSAGGEQSLTIEKAYLSERQSGQDSGTSYPVTFNNCDIDPRNSGQGVTPYNGGIGITIPAGKSGWSNWIDTGSSIDGAKEYFITFYIRQLTGEESMSISYWQGEEGSEHSYTRAGDYAEISVWGEAGTSDPSTYGIEETWARYVPQGTYTSQIYNTGMDDPQFDKIIWEIKRNNYPDANLILRIRSNDSYDALTEDNNWADELAVDTNSSVTGNASIASIAGGRYVQFQAEFSSLESGENDTHQTHDNDDDYDNDEDYDMSVILKNVTISWPGQERMAEVSSYYTLKPDYGKFTVEIDDQPLTKGLETKITAEKTSFRQKEITCSLNTEVEFRNTDK